MQTLTDAGLGLDHDALRLERTPEGWVVAGSSLRAEVATAVGVEAACVEQVGSSSVVGLLAKPIIDLAVGVSVAHDLDAVRRRLEGAGWIYRGDAGESGGHVFVLEAWRGHRVAHAHVVAHGGAQWRDYLRLRDLLRRSPAACQRYEEVKVELVATHGRDREAYTEGKTGIVGALLRDADGA